jgi:DNA-binding FadR family transcriptional regulator
VFVSVAPPATHSADRVFDQLAAAILRGDLPARSPLPSERLLGERFDVSRIIVRQAVHRLAELGLVEVRQGGATLVTDPDEVSDLRVLALWYRLAPRELSADLQRDIVEKQYLQGLSIVSVASRRADPAALTRLANLVEAFARGSERKTPIERLEQHFWRGLARAGRNRIFVMEVDWWYASLPERPVSAKPTRQQLLGFYAELVRLLARDGDAAVAYYLSAITPPLHALFGDRRPK